MIEYEKLFAAQNEVDPRPDTRGFLVIAGFLCGMGLGLLLAFSAWVFLVDSR